MRLTAIEHAELDDRARSCSAEGVCERCLAALRGYDRGRPRLTPPPLVRLGPGGDFTRDIMPEDIQ